MSVCYSINLNGYMHTRLIFFQCGDAPQHISYAIVKSPLPLSLDVQFVTASRAPGLDDQSREVFFLLDKSLHLIIPMSSLLTRAGMGRVRELGGGRYVYTTTKHNPSCKSASM